MKEEKEKTQEREHNNKRGGEGGGKKQCTMEMQVPQNSPKTMCNGTYSKRP